MTPRLYWFVPPLAAAVGGALQPELAWLQQYQDPDVIVYDNPDTPGSELEPDAWWNYDFGNDDPADFINHPDWPVTMVWSQYANVEDVKHYLHKLPAWDCAGVPPIEVCGGVNYARFGATELNGGAFQFDGDSGQTGPCEESDDGNGQQRMHTRVYAPSSTDYFVSLEWGQYALATTHYDRNHGWGDPCGDEVEAFGWSETVETRIVVAAANDFRTACVHFLVCDENRSDLFMENAGNFDVGDDENRRHESDGYASMVYFKEYCEEHTSNPFEPIITVLC